MSPDTPQAWPPIADEDRCLCSSGLTYGECCGPAHSGETASPTAERLMRSRYTAFVLGDAAYLLSSWRADTRPPSIELDPAQRWRGLEIVSTSGGGAFDTTGTVEFIARFRQADSARTDALHEASRFERVGRQWFYVDGEQS